MKNFINEGDTLDVVAPSGGVVSGSLYVIGSLVGVATTTVAAGVSFALKTSGVFELPKLSTDVFVAGAKLYWDATNLWLTVAAGSNTQVGVVAEPAANPSAVGRVLLRRFL